jgi:hypothetical protein
MLEYAPDLTEIALQNFVLLDIWNPVIESVSGLNNPLSAHLEP